jgi:hypothetical protein
MQRLYVLVDFFSPLDQPSSENIAGEWTTQLEYGMMPAQPITLLTAILTLSLSLPLAAQTSTVAPQEDPKSAKTGSDSTPAWKAAIEARRNDLIIRNGPGTDASLREQLLQMRTKDQTARGFIPRPSASKQELGQSLAATDAQLTAELKQIVDQKGWPTISMVGIEASNAAMLVLTHTPDHAWQLQLLPTLEQLADAGKIDPSGLALVVDKELVSQGQLQRYGSQFKAVNGGMAMYGVEDPDQLDKRRAQALLSPMKEYRELLEQTYHLKATGAIVSAPRITPSTPTAKP